MSMPPQENDETPDKVPVTPVGEQLCNARKAKSMSVNDVAHRLKLDVKVVRGLELGDYESLPEQPVYTRGYLLAYLRLMELPVALLKPFDETNPVNKPLLVANHSARFARGRDVWVRYVSFGLVVSLSMAIVLWVMEQSIDVPGIDEITNGQADDKRRLGEGQPVALTTAAESGLTRSVTADASPAAEAPVAGGMVPEKADDVETADDVVVAETVSQASGLAMVFSGNTWIRLEDAEGNRLYDGTYEEGQEINLNRDGELHLTIGRTQHVKLVYNGKPVDLSGYGPNEVARLVLGKRTE